MPPRVLLLTSEAPHTAAAGAIVLHRLFASYPPDRLRVVTGQLPPATAGRLDCAYAPLDLKVNRLNRTRFWPWRTALRVLGGPDWLGLGAVDRALGGFEPDVVATLMQDSWYYDLAARFARRRQLPLVLFIHDEPAGFEPVAPFLRARQRARDAAVYRQAAARLCISAGMARAFAADFGAAGDVLLPPRSDRTPTQSPAQCRDLKQPGRLTLGYAGGLHYGYGEQLLRLLPVLRRTGTVIEYFGPEPGGISAALREATDVLRFNGYATTPEEAWRTLLGRCDALLQPYLNPPGVHARQYATHFPSKLGDCLTTGLPLLITGPAEASGVAWCLAHPGCALAVTSPAEADFETALQRLRDDGALRVSLATTAQAVASAFSAGALRDSLLATLSAAARSSAAP